MPNKIETKQVPACMQELTLESLILNITRSQVRLHSLLSKGIFGPAWEDCCKYFHSLLGSVCVCVCSSVLPVLTSKPNFGWCSILPPVVFLLQAGHSSQFIISLFTILSYFSGFPSRDISCLCNPPFIYALSKLLLLEHVLSDYLYLIHLFMGFTFDVN